MNYTCLGDALFLRFYTEYYRKIYEFCLKKLNGKHDLACDCVQNTFFAAFKNISVLQTHEKPIGWLYKTAKNYVQLAIRQLNREQGELRLCDLSSEIPSYYNFVVEIENKMSEINVDYADVLNELTNDEQKLHQMFYVDGLSTENIAKTFGITGGACRTRIHRLKIKIYDIVQKKMCS